MSRTKQTTELVQTALLMAIIIVLALIPMIGYVYVGPIRATTVHIPVIIGAILLGPKKGAFLGGVFGLTSLLNNTFSPTIASFVFSPFAPAPEGVAGNPLALVIAFVPRILIGVMAGLVAQAFKRGQKFETLGCVLSGFVGSITNTILVMGGIYLFFGKSYAAVNNMSHDALLGFIGGVIAVNGVVEAALAALLSTAIARPLLGLQKRRQAP